MTQNLVKTLIAKSVGGGILLFVILITNLSNLNAIELTQICTSGQSCEITTPQSEITNNGTFKESNDGIKINARIANFINYGIITKTNGGNQSIKFESAGYISHFINYGTMDSSIWVANNAPGLDTFTNYGVLKGGIHNETSTTMLNNFGSIGRWMSNGNISVSSKGKVLIQNYALMINENPATFNAFNGSSSSAHLVISGSGVRFKDANSKLILDFGENFEFGAKYLISKLATDTSGGAYNALGVDFGRLVPKNDIYVLSQSGEYFIAKLAPQYGAVGALYKANIRKMNNFYTISNSMIYPRKHNSVILRERSDRRNSNTILSLRADSQNLRGNPKDLRAKRSNHPPYENIIDSAFSLKSYESFSYQNESQNLQTRRIQRQNKRNYSRSRNPRNNNPVILMKSEESKKKNRDSSIASLTQNDKYYFILTPFINHNLFFQSGRYNLSGFDYGFLTAFSARVAESNSLGAHFAFSYGSLSDSHDKNFRISNLNLNLGLNYKLDLVWDMYLKARGDVFYFLNQVKTLTMEKAIKPNNLGFGASVLFGKDFDFKQGGVLGIEAGLDYKALQSNNIKLHDNTYQKQLYNLIYVDLGVNYAKYFGGFGVNLGGGFKANLAPNLAKSILLANSQNLRFVLDNDKYLGYANVALSYILNARNFDMEFSIAYYGNYGDRIISNGGGFEWRTTW